MDPETPPDSRATEPKLAPGRNAPPPGAGERELWVGRPHWLHFAGGITVWVVAAGTYTMLITGIDALSGTAKAYLAGIPVLVSALILGVRLFLRIYGLRYRLTEERLFLERGILSQTIDQTELIRVDDVRVRKSVVDRLFGLGSVEVMSTDASDSAVLLLGIRRPGDVAEIVRTRMRTLRGRSLFIENL